MYVHHTPDVTDRILTTYLDTQMVPYKAPCSFAAEQVLRPHGFLLLRPRMPKADFNRIGPVLAVILEARDSPRSLHICSVSVEIINEDSLYQTLV